MSITLTSPAITFVADSRRNDAVVFTADSSTLSSPRRMTLRRVLPKGTPKAGSYPGNARNFLTLHWTESVGDAAYPMVAQIEISRIVTMDPTKVTDMRTRLAALIVDSELDAFFAALSLPS